VLYLQNEAIRVCIIYLHNDLLYLEYKLLTAKNSTCNEEETAYLMTSTDFRTQARLKITDRLDKVIRFVFDSEGSAEAAILLVTS
jgi:hypothetical protein